MFQLFSQEHLKWAEQQKASLDIVEKGGESIIPDRCEIPVLF